MKRNREKTEEPFYFSLPRLIALGIVVILVCTVVASCFEAANLKHLAEEASETMMQQCMRFDKITAASRTKSLFRITDMLRDLRERLAANPALINDEYLEQYVDGLRISGIAVLDENGKLLASGYTRRFAGSSWNFSADRDFFPDVIEHPFEIYAERVSENGEYYDVAAVSRTDAKGVLVGFYHQPTGLISGTQSDMESMLTGIAIEHDGHYAITENNKIRATSDSEMKGKSMEESEVLQKLSEIPHDRRMHFISADRYYFGYHTISDSYALYVYYPLSTVLRHIFSTVGIAFAIYCLVCLCFFSVRNRMLYQSQRELRQSNEKLTESVKMLRSLETLYFSMFHVDLEKDTYSTVYLAPWLDGKIPMNETFETLTHIAAGEMVAEEFRAVMTGQVNHAYICEALHTRDSFYIDYQAVRGGAKIWCRLTVSAVTRSRNGVPKSVLILLQDVNEERSKEAAYQQAILKEAEEAKIANNAKSDFLRRVSHDVRTPLNGIRGYIDIAAEHPDDLELQKHCREGASVAVRALSDLVTGVLDMSRLEGGVIVPENRPFDLSVLLDEINTILRPLAREKNVRYEVLHNELPVNRLVGSPRYVSQIIMNITGNAVKYSKNGGYIRVNTVMTDRTDDTVSYEFICEDDGIGMSEEFQKHMFEPFTQEKVNARTAYEGAGLGLSIVKKLVDALGGSIACESEKDVGTAFRVRLTFRIDKTEKDDEANDKQSEKPLAGRNILVAEDNELNMDIACFVLEECGANVAKAWNGREAIELFSDSEDGFFDMIFMDILMPEAGGMEATRTIRALNRRDAETVPIAAMSANAFAEDIEQSRQAGMNDHIAKPIDKQKLIAVALRLMKSKR